MTARPTCRVCYVLPAQSPYISPRLAALARDPDIEVSLLVERDRIGHRPGWYAENIPGCHVEVLQSQVRQSQLDQKDMGYVAQGVRLVPWRLPLALRRLKPDFVVVCNATQLAIAWLARPFLGYRIALNVEDTPHSQRNIRGARRWLKSVMYRRADCYFAFSAMAEDYLHSLGINRHVERTSWSLDSVVFDRDSSERDFQRERRGVTARMAFLFVGQLIPRKGVFPMLEAWAQIDPSLRRRACLMIAGDGPLREDAMHFCKDQALQESVLFMGSIDYAEMPILYSMADVVLLPTLEDLFSLVVLEGMMAGTPVLTTPFNGACELIKDGVDGWICDPRDIPGFSAKLRDIIANADGVQAMRIRVKSKAKAFDTEPVMARVAQAFKRYQAGGGN